MESFGKLLKLCRKRCWDSARERPLTQERLAELLGIESGVESLSGGTVSNWERGLNQIRRDDRHVLVGLIKVLHQGGGIQTAHAAKRLLLAGNYRSLDDEELHQINPDWKSIETETIGASSFPSQVEQEAMLPSPTYTRLFGVTEVIDQLLGNILSVRSPHLLVIVGLGGMGKTAVADAIARRVIHAGEFAWVIWVSSESLQPAVPEEVVAGSLTDTIINTLFRQIYPDRMPEPNPLRQLAQVRAELKRHRYLIVIDNLEDSAETIQLLSQLNALGGPSKFLLTARHYPVLDADIFILPLQEMTQASAIAFLRYQAKTGGVSQLARVRESELEQIVMVIGGHPLALRLTSRLARMMPLSELFAGFQRAHSGLVAQLYQTIYDALWQRLTPLQKQLLRVMPLAAHTGATSDQLLNISRLSAVDFWSVLPELVELCLIESRGSLQEQRYGIHNLTGHFLRSRWETGKDRAGTSPVEGIQANVAYWVRYLGELAEDQWHILDIERFNIFRAIQFSLSLPKIAITPALKEDWLHLSELLFRFVEQRGYGYEWLPLLARLVEAFENYKRIQCKLLNRLGEIYRLSFQFAEAIRIHQEALQIAGAAEDELEVARAHFNLGNDYLRYKLFEAAAENAQVALEAFKGLGLAGRETAAALNLLGTVVQRQDQLDISEIYLREAVTIWRQLDQAPELARTLNNLALTLQHQQKVEEALICYAEAKIVLGKTSSELDRTLIHLSEGALYFDLKQYDAAETTFRRIDLDFLQETKHYLYLALALNNLGNVAFVCGNHVEADRYLTECFSAWQQIGEEVEMADTLLTLGNIAAASDRPDTAVSYYEEALAILSLHGDESGTNKLAQEIEQKLNTLERK